LFLTRQAPPPRSLSLSPAEARSAPIYTLSLHDALPISEGLRCLRRSPAKVPLASNPEWPRLFPPAAQSLEQSRRNTRRDTVERRSEEHTSELQSPDHLVCRLLLEKKVDLDIDILPGLCN